METNWSNGEQCKKVAATSRRWVNQYRSQHFFSVATSQRRDVATLRRQLEICTSSFKVRIAQKSGYREAYERGHGTPEQSDTDFDEVLGICIVSHFCWILE